MPPSSVVVPVEVSKFIAATSLSCIVIVTESADGLVGTLGISSITVIIIVSSPSIILSSTIPSILTVTPLSPSRITADPDICV